MHLHSALSFPGGWCNPNITTLLCKIYPLCSIVAINIAVVKLDALFLKTRANGEGKDFNSFIILDLVRLLLRCAW